MYLRRLTAASSAHRSLLVAALVLLLAGCASAPSPSTPTSAPSTAPAPVKAPKPVATFGAADIALRQLGRPYRWGGQTPSGFDCSGLVRYSYGQVGISLPRTTRDQRAATRMVGYDAASRGDLLFFRTGAKGWHVGIYLGDGEFVHAPSSGKTVTTGSMRNPYYREHLVDMRRVRPSVLVTRSD